MATTESGPPYAIGYLIWRVSLRAQAQTKHALEPLGVTHTQYSVLASLYGLTSQGERPSQRALADWSGLEPMHVSKVIRTLERDGLVARTASGADSRAVELALTSHGAEIAAAAIRTVSELDERRLAPLGDTGAGQLSRLLRELLASIEDLDRDQAAGREPERSTGT